MPYRHALLFVIMLIFAALPTIAGQPAIPDLDRYNTVLGTQTIGAAYGFTSESRLLETARAIRAMGSHVIKFAMGNGGGPAIRKYPSLTQLGRDEPSHRAVLDMPFAYFIIWAYPVGVGEWRDGFSAGEQAKEYRQMYDFARHLLVTYNGTGKTFLLGHWEGDWALRGNYNAGTDESVTPTAIQGMIDWLNIRQKAIDDAKRETHHRNVQVYGYTEVNLVKIAMQGRPSVTNAVLPKTHVDFVSYSSYDSGVNLKPALDYIESKLPPKPEIRGKRVFIGEYGFPAITHSPQEQDSLSRQVMKAGLEWRCPFVLYWEMYNNEVKEGKQQGFWLIDDKARKQPVYYTHQNYYRWAQEFLGAFKRKQRRLPSAEEFNKAAVEELDRVAPAPPKR